MERKYKDSKVNLAGEQWTVKYYERVIIRGKYYKAVRIPDKKEIWISLLEENEKEFTQEQIEVTFKKAILPIVVEDVKKKYKAEDVADALKLLGIDERAAYL